MGQRRSNRGLPPRSEAAIAAHSEDAWIITEVAAGRMTMQPETRSALRRLALEDVLTVGFGRGSAATLLPRGQRILASIRGEICVTDET